MEKIGGKPPAPKSVTIRTTTSTTRGKATIYDVGKIEQMAAFAKRENSGNKGEIDRHSTYLSYAMNEAAYTDEGYFRDGSNGTGDVVLANKLPNEGEPNSKETLYNEDGSVKQERVYGPDRKPLIDRDWNHGGVGHEFPHEHEWKDGERQEGVPFVGPPPPPRPVPNTNMVKTNESNNIGKAAGWAAAGTAVYWIISIGSRILFPPRNLVPVP